MTRRKKTKSDTGRKIREKTAEDLAEFEQLERGLYRLSAQQESALDCLLGGQTITDAADAAGVARQTVSGWLNHDATFVAAYNWRRQLLTADITNGLRALTLKAFAALEAELSGSQRLDAAKSILRIVTSLPQAKGPILPADVEDEWERRADERLRSMILFAQTKIRLPSFSADASEAED